MTQKTEPARRQANDNDMVLVERSLIGAACNAIDKKRDAPGLLGKLREIAFRAPSFSKPPGNAIDGLLASARPYLAQELLINLGYTWDVDRQWVAPPAKSGGDEAVAEVKFNACVWRSFPIPPEGTLLYAKPAK